MRRLVVGVAALVCACAETQTPAPTTRATLAVPDWVEGRAPTNDGASAATIDAPSVMPSDAFATKTIGAASSPKPKWSARTIDLDVKDADIHDVCRLLADVGKTNIVVADDVHGSVTIKMKHVPWDQALEVILRAKGFDTLRDGDVILVVAGAAK